jgi:hypothetical protein
VGYVVEPFLADAPQALGDAAPQTLSSRGPPLS